MVIKDSFESKRVLKPQNAQGSPIDAAAWAFYLLALGVLFGSNLHSL
jgi:hypothetical protein